MLRVSKEERSRCALHEGKIMARLENVPQLAFLLKHILITPSLQWQTGRVQTATSGCRNTCSKATCRAVPAICWRERAHSWGVMRPSDLVRQPLLTRHPIIKSKLQDTIVSIWHTPFYIGVLANDEGCSWSCTKRAQIDLILNGLRQYTANKPTASERKQINIIPTALTAVCLARTASAERAHQIYGLKQRMLLALKLSNAPTFINSCRPF